MGRKEKEFPPATQNNTIVYNLGLFFISYDIIDKPMDKM